MKLDSMRLRALFMGAGLVALVVFLAAGGRLGPGKGTIMIEYGAQPEALEGMAVTIDGEPAGTLHAMGSYTRTGFAVAAGPHRVVVVGPRVSCQPRQVEVKNGQMVLLVVDVGEAMAGGDPQVKTPIYLH